MHKMKSIQKSKEKKGYFSFNKRGSSFFFTFAQRKKSLCINYPPVNSHAISPHQMKKKHLSQTRNPFFCPSNLYTNEK